MYQAEPVSDFHCGNIQARCDFIVASASVQWKCCNKNNFENNINYHVTRRTSIWISLTILSIYLFNK